MGEFDGKMDKYQVDPEVPHHGGTPRVAITPSATGRRVSFPSHSQTSLESMMWAKVIAVPLSPKVTGKSGVSCVPGAAKNEAMPEKKAAPRPPAGLQAKTAKKPPEA
jgi:hypothetical protein